MINEVLLLEANQNKNNGLESIFLDKLKFSVRAANTIDFQDAYKGTKKGQNLKI